MARKATWTDEQVQWLRENYESKSLSKLSAYLKKGRSTIHAYANKIGLKSKESSVDWKAVWEERRTRKAKSDPIITKLSMLLAYGMKKKPNNISTYEVVEGVMVALRGGTKL